MLGAQILALVRTDGPPGRLPGTAEFDGNNPDVGAWYEAAWLAVELLGDQLRPDAAPALLPMPHEAGDLDRAFRRCSAPTRPSSPAAWRAHLKALAS